MKLFRHVQRSLGRMQAVAVLVASLVIGLGLSAIQLSYTLHEQRRSALVLCQEILSLAEGGATRAAWTLDASLARAIVSSIMANGSVSNASIVDDTGGLLAREQRDEEVDQGWFTRWMASAFIEDHISGTKELVVRDQGQWKTVGVLSVALATGHIAQSFANLAASTILVSLVSAFMVGLVLLALSSRLVTSPLRQVAQRISAIDAENPEANPLSIPRAHERNELGELLRCTNQMLDRLSASQQQLRHLATRDSLTGLPNRELIQDRLNKALARAHRNDTSVAVLFLDLDRFKNINDTMGHEAGDELLIAVAGALRNTIRANDSIGRLGGDEFLVVLEDEVGVDKVVATVRRLVDVLTVPFVLSGQEIRSSASIGIAMYPTDAQDSSTLMRHADLAMYKAKEVGGGSWHFFAEEMSNGIRSRMTTENALAMALGRGELLLHFQPEVAARTGKIVCCEALLRWQRNGELVPADEFISVAEDSGIIIAIGDWVLERACEQITEWSAHHTPVPIALNVSAKQLREGEFVERVLSALRRHDIDGSLLALEITETTLMKDLDRSAEFLERLRQQGVRVSIDDFGTGYSSLSYLTSLPVTSLKIDRSFVSGSRHSETVLKAILALSKAVNLETVAEGVETEEQRRLLVSNGCDVLQGLLIERPLDAVAFCEGYLEARPVVS